MTVIGTIAGQAGAATAATRDASIMIGTVADTTIGIPARISAGTAAVTGTRGTAGMEASITGRTSAVITTGTAAGTMTGTTTRVRRLLHQSRDMIRVGTLQPYPDRLSRLHGPPRHVSRANLA
jgi:hypothetical protein